MHVRKTSIFLFSISKTLLYSFPSIQLYQNFESNKSTLQFIQRGDQFCGSRLEIPFIILISPFESRIEKCVYLCSKFNLGNVMKQMYPIV